MASICKRCLIPDTFMIDEQQGSTVCTKCGFVESFYLIDEKPEYAIAIDESGYDHRRTGPSNNDLLNEQGLCVEISSGFKDRNLSWWNSQNIMTKDKVLLRGFQTIERYAEKLRLTDNIIRSCMEVFKKLSEMKMTCTRPHAELVGALIYHISNVVPNCKKLSIDDILVVSATKSATGDLKKILNCLKMIKHFCQTHYPQYTKQHKRRMQEIEHENSRFDISSIERMMTYLNMTLNTRRYFSLMLDRSFSGELSSSYSSATILCSVSIAFSMFLFLEPDLRKICEISSAGLEYSLKLYNFLYEYRFDFFAGLGCNFNNLYRL